MSNQGCLSDSRPTGISSSKRSRWSHHLGTASSHLICFPLPLLFPTSTNDTATTQPPMAHVRNQGAGLDSCLLSTLLLKSFTKSINSTSQIPSIFFYLHYLLYQVRPPWALTWIIKNTARVIILKIQSYHVIALPNIILSNPLCLG